ncbi:MAG: hypothetical protein OEV92_00695 [Nitrospinota bacterium]|nr:hypothetical protein [Nitrospinota bacterium]
METIKYLLSGIDTLECGYYLENRANSEFFLVIGATKELLRETKSKNPKPVELDDMEFLLEPYGSGSGYPFILSNREYRIQCGEFNNPSFFVKYNSEALWKHTAQGLHEKFTLWAASQGFEAFKAEGLSRVDFSFDYHIPEIDFTEKNIVTMSSKDSIHRENNKVQTYTFGKGDVVLRIYDKVAEIHQSSHKEWFFDLWGVKENVWRIEWQVRRNTLKRFGIRTMTDLAKRKKALLEWLSGQHDILRIPSEDSNKSRWPTHPLWIDIQKQIANLPDEDIGKSVDENASINSREAQIMRSIYGYYKRVAAIMSAKGKHRYPSLGETMERVRLKLGLIHDPMTWDIDIATKTSEIELGKW